MPRNPTTLETAFRVFQIVEPIGEGGSGRVYRVQDDSGAPFAAKVLHPERLTAEGRKRFKNEVAFCQRNVHNNVVQVLDHGVVSTVSGSAPFYVMPLYRGSLRSLMTSRIPPNKVPGYFAQLLDGVEAAHLQGVIHRDLKPENVLFSPDADRLVVADFGIAHFQEEELYTAVETGPAARLANFQYAAPEQRGRGQPVTIAADIYALGLILNELFTGRVPHGTDFVAIGTVVPDLAYLDDVVAAMIRQEASRRPGSIDAIKADLIGRKKAFVTRQELVAAQHRVVPASDIVDPLIDDPPRIVDFDWSNGSLTLVLSRAVTPAWVAAFQNIGSRTSVWGADVGDFSFSRDKAVVRADHDRVQDIINNFKAWIPMATDVYRDRLRRDKREQEEVDRRRLELQRQELERRLAVRQNVKL